MSEKKDAGYIQNLWRPMMGWMYMLICLLDMAVFPVLWSLLQAMMHQPITQWNPLTLQGAGLFHIAMGAVLGIAAFGRTQEKLAGTAANPMATTTTQNVNMTGNQAGGFGSGPTNNFGGNNGGFGSSPAFGAPSSGGFGAPSSGFGSAPASTGFGTGGFGSSPSPAPAAFGASSSAPQPIAMSSTGKKVVPQDPDPVL